MKLKTNKDVLDAQKAASKVHAGGDYEMKNGKPVLINQPQDALEKAPKKEK